MPDAANLRGVFRSDSCGKVHFRCVKPEFYPLPNDGSHVVLTEKNRLQLFREIQLFFDEGR